MATLDQNLQTIRTDIYGKNVRAAIADAIEQSDAEVDDRIDSIRDQIEARDLFITMEAISGSSGDYRMVVTNAT